MFGKDARAPDAGTQSRSEGFFRGLGGEERRVAAWIGASIIIRGDLTSSENMTLAGKVEGNVSVPEHTVVIAPGARIEGDIVAGAVAVHGQVVGTIRAERKVEIGETGSVEGNVFAPRMAVAEGAVLRGEVGVRQGSASTRPGSAGQAGQPGQPGQSGPSGRPSPTRPG